MNNFQKNLKFLTDKYTQKYVAEQTGFSQSSINNYLTKNSEPSIQFLIALKKAFEIEVDDFLFGEINDNQENVSYDRFVGNYLVYYFNNDSYKGEVHISKKNTLNYGVISIVKEAQHNKNVAIYGTFTKDKKDAIKLLKTTNKAISCDEILQLHKAFGNLYLGELFTNEQSLFVELSNKANGDYCFMIFNNPPSIAKYIGGVGTVNTIARGREHNPCVEYIILSKKLIDKPEGEIYRCLQFNDYKVNFDSSIKEMVSLFKRLYVEKNDISLNLTDNQKNSIIQNKLEYYFNEILESNYFRFAKISNREDDMIYKLIKEGENV